MGNEVAVKEQKAPVAYHNGEVQLENLEGAYRFAKYVIESGMAPKGFEKPEAVLVAWQYGAELGMKPMQSLKHIGVIGGKAVLYGDAVKGVCFNKGVVADWKERLEGEGDALTAICIVYRVGIPTPSEGRFSVADAKKAGLWGKAGPWQSYPKDMLMHKARKRAVSIFGDVLAGLPVMEDIQDVPAERPPLTERAVEATQDPLLAPVVDEAQEELPLVPVTDLSDRS